MPYNEMDYSSLDAARISREETNRGINYLTPTDRPLTTTMDVREEDINAVILQQNILYAVATLTATTFLITAIVLGKD
jgi:hypothetical protein